MDHIAHLKNQFQIINTFSKLWNVNRLTMDKRQSEKLTWTLRTTNNKLSETLTWTFSLVFEKIKMGRVNTEGQQTKGDQKSSAEWFEFHFTICCFLGKRGGLEGVSLHLLIVENLSLLLSKIHRIQKCKICKIFNISLLLIHYSNPKLWYHNACVLHSCLELLLVTTYTFEKFIEINVSHRGTNYGTTLRRKLW